jgi:hypothetical protein
MALLRTSDRPARLVLVVERQSTSRPNLEGMGVDQWVKTIAFRTERAGKAEELAELPRSMAPFCHAEPANVSWDVWQDEGQCFALRDRRDLRGCGPRDRAT